MSHHCLQHAPCPVAVVHAPAVPSPTAGEQRIVVGVDGSTSSQRALRWAVDEAERREASIHVVHAWQPPVTGPYPFIAPDSDVVRFEADTRRILDAALEGITTSRRPTTVLTLGSPSSAILAAAERGSLIVVGRRGVSGFERFLLGSTATEVVHHAPCPVVVVPPDRSER